MKKISILGIILIGLVSCQPKAKQPETAVIETKTEVPPAYPEELGQVFAKHGGIDAWKTMKTLTFEIVKPNGNEKQTIDLISRNDLVETNLYRIGFDGRDSWILQEEDSFKGNARFYHNLMFYFYAMPFVLSDSGVIYEKTDNLQYEGKSYPGFKISFEANVGDAPDDNYFVYYDAEDHSMQWLGYTVTFGKGEANNNVKFIRYDDWKEVNGLVVPNSITWYKSEGHQVIEPARTISFENVNFSEKRVSASIFEKPDAAIYVSESAE